MSFSWSYHLTISWLQIEYFFIFLKNVFTAIKIIIFYSIYEITDDVLVKAFGNFFEKYNVFENVMKLMKLFYLLLYSTIENLKNCVTTANAIQFCIDCYLAFQIKGYIKVVVYKNIFYFLEVEIYFIFVLVLRRNKIIFFSKYYKAFQIKKKLKLKIFQPTSYKYNFPPLKPNSN